MRNVSTATTILVPCYFSFNEMTFTFTLCKWMLWKAIFCFHFFFIVIKHVLFQKLIQRHCLSNKSFFSSFYLFQTKKRYHAGREIKVISLGLAYTYIPPPLFEKSTFQKFIVVCSSFVVCAIDRVDRLKFIGYGRRM